MKQLAPVYVGELRNVYKFVTAERMPRDALGAARPLTNEEILQELTALAEELKKFHHDSKHRLIDLNRGQRHVRAGQFLFERFDFRGQDGQFLSKPVDTRVRGTDNRSRADESECGGTGKSCQPRTQAKQEHHGTATRLLVAR